MSIKEQLQRQVQFFHPEKKYPFLRGGFSSAAHAALFGLREQFYNAIKESFSDRVNESAKTLCQDSDYAAAIKALPFKKKARIVVIGDSLTDDSQSWFAIIERSFALLRPDDNIRFTNLAVSGDTTAQLLGSVIPAANMKADLYFSFSGTNDARIQGGSRYKPCTSIDEVGRNLASVIDFAKRNTKAPWVWLTPVGVDPDRVAEHEFLKPLMASWCNEHIAQVAELIKQQAENVIDLRPHFTDLQNSNLLDEDGLHWTIDGHEVAAKVIIKQLAAIIG
ncbi:SGNH/GDSL hydrolase family protein [Thalassomonas viridans]|uniref:SGNH/GDSL hydrolase family protein n=1 Tax=Thalassomonas viridans TaxID=137584 RepID=A0AAF0CDW8_9GAMM|nr:SGNH/GDSL hydrolase family protein [Thalassomonas viridans]WDE09091.1 SGNH/GDSL hydrolase family protein [Thalassomonas viridans]